MRKINLRVVLVCLALAFSLTFVLATPEANAATMNHAPAQAGTQLAQPGALIHPINRVACDGRTDFLEIWSGQYLDCFANTGFTAVDIVHVYYVCSGNNSAYLYFTNDGILYLPYWSCSSVPAPLTAGSTTITDIYIVS
jgi:hypothetical protein